MKFLSLLLTMAGLLVATSTLQAAPTTFKDLDRAKAAAKEQKKPVFLLFTGTSWCSYCQKLEAEVLTKKEFKDYAKDNLIICELDFEGPGVGPKKSVAWAKEYAITGYPTVILLDSEGKKIGKTGYFAGGPTKYVDNLKSLLPAPAKTDKPAAPAK